MDKTERRNTEELSINSKSSQPVNQGMQMAKHCIQPEITYSYKSECTQTKGKGAQQNALDNCDKNIMYT
jgi:hypothetical protein